MSKKCYPSKDDEIAGHARHFGYGSMLLPLDSLTVRNLEMTTHCVTSSRQQEVAKSILTSFILLWRQAFPRAANHGDRAVSVIS